MSWLNRLSNLRRGDKLSGELDEELEFHLDARTRDNLAAGMAPDAARLDARRRFGNRTLAKERTHEMNIVVSDIAVSMQTIGQDVRYAFRGLRKSPGFTAVAILALGLGIGANTAVFSVVENVLLCPLPYRDPSALAQLWNTYLPAFPPLPNSPGDFLDFQRQAASFSEM